MCNGAPLAMNEGAVVCSTSRYAALEGSNCCIGVADDDASRAICCITDDGFSGERSVEVDGKLQVIMSAQNKILVALPVKIMCVQKI